MPGGGRGSSGPLCTPQLTVRMGAMHWLEGWARIIPRIGRPADGTAVAGKEDWHGNAPIGAEEGTMTITAETTPTDTRMDRQGRPCQSPVITLQARDQAGAVVAQVTDATGVLETVPECPAFPH